MLDVLQDVRRNMFDSPINSMEVKYTPCVMAAQHLTHRLADQLYAIARARAAFGLRVAQADAINALQTKCRYLDVGGLKFHTSADVMQRNGPHLLSVLASDEFSCEADEDGYRPPRVVPRRQAVQRRGATGVSGWSGAHPLGTRFCF